MDIWFLWFVLNQYARKSSHRPTYRVWKEKPSRSSQISPAWQNNMPDFCLSLLICAKTKMFSQNNISSSWFRSIQVSSMLISLAFTLIFGKLMTIKNQITSKRNLGLSLKLKKDIEVKNAQFFLSSFKRLYLSCQTRRKKFLKT